LRGSIMKRNRSFALLAAADRYIADLGKNAG
jgi:hypothetical protein